MKKKLPDFTEGRESLGPFEQTVLTAVATFGNAGVYGIPLYAKVCGIAQRLVNQGSMRVTLGRLEKKHMITSWQSDKDSEPRGRSRRYYKIEPEGMHVLTESILLTDRITKFYRTNVQPKRKTK